MILRIFLSWLGWESVRGLYKLLELFYKKKSSPNKKMPQTYCLIYTFSKIEVKMETFQQFNLLLYVKCVIEFLFTSCFSVIKTKDGSLLPRLVSKNGQCRIQMKNVPYKKSLVSDIFTTAVEMSWRLVPFL